MCGTTFASDKALQCIGRAIFDANDQAINNFVMILNLSALHICPYSLARKIKIPVT